MITVGINTWKTHLMVSVRHADNAGLERHLQTLLTSEVNRLDALASRFRPDSELSAVNQRAGEWVDVSWSFVAVLSACLDAARMTGGLVDPTLGAAVKAAGYDRWAGQESAIPATAHRGQWRAVGIRPGSRQAQVRIPHGTALDLGSVAKGWLADRIATAIARSGYEVCANMGGDLRVIADRPWTVWADPEIAGRDAVSVDLTDGALATSGTTHRRWEGGHHIIDPRSGQCADRTWSSVSVVAATAAEANAAATAGLILGTAGPAWMDRMGLPALFTSTEESAVAGAWPLEVAA